MNVIESRHNQNGKMSVVKSERSPAAHKIHSVFGDGESSCGSCNKSSRKLCYYGSSENHFSFLSPSQASIKRFKTQIGERDLRHKWCSCNVFH